MRKRPASFVFRSAIVVLFATTFAFAANRQIPQRLLDQAARTRAAFTPAERARTQALEARLSSKMSVNDVTAMTRGETPGMQSVIMLDYARLLEKEARAEQRGKMSGARLAMAAAESQLQMGMASGMAGVGGGVVRGAAGGQHAEQAPPGGTAPVVAVPTKTPAKAPVPKKK